MKPNVLYHGSPNQDIAILEPSEESLGHKLPGEYVFATQYKELAVMFLAPKVAPMQMSQFGKHYILIAQCTEQVYRNADKAGAIYELPSDSFQQGGTDMPEVEWYSSEPIRPKHRDVYASSLDAMDQCGVKVYFVNETTYTAIQNAEDHGWGILQSLSPANS
jgi:hypothetical protein